MRRIVPAIAGLLTVCLTGCSDIAPPQWFSPGPAPVQRTRAQRFDPYPDPYVAHDDGSARPRDYLKPPPEADNAARSARGLAYPERWQSVGN